MYIFQRKKINISCEPFAPQPVIHMKFQVLFSLKNKLKKFRMLAAAIF